MSSDSGQVGAYKGRGVFVPHGLTAAEVMEGAAALEQYSEDWDIPHYTARDMAAAVLLAARAVEEGACGNQQSASGDQQ